MPVELVVPAIILCSGLKREMDSDQSIYIDGGTFFAMTFVPGLTYTRRARLVVVQLLFMASTVVNITGTVRARDYRPPVDVVSREST